MPSLKSDLRGFVVSVLASAVVSFVGSWWQGVLKAQEVAKVHLDPLQSGVAALPTWVVVVSLLMLGLLVAAALAWLHGFYEKLTHRRDDATGPARHTVPAPRAPDELIEEANRKAEMDGLLRRLEVAEGLRDNALEQCTAAKGSLNGEREANRQLNIALDQRLAELKETNAKLDHISPLVQLYKRAVELEERLIEFRGELQEQEKKIDINDPVSEWIENTPVTQARFNNDFRPKLVKLALDLKQNYGWVIPDLIDEKLTVEIYGSLGLRHFIAGVAEVKEKTGVALLAAASQLDV
jgi:hypothetical protein